MSPEPAASTETPAPDHRAGAGTGSTRRPSDRYPPIADYGLLSDGNSTALVSRTGSIDFCCMPRIDAPSVVARLLDWDRGGHCSICLDEDEVTTSRRYVDDSMVLETTLRSDRGTVVVRDALELRDRPQDPERRLLRVVECTEGEVDLRVEVSVRFDWGGICPWLRCHDTDLHTAIGGTQGLVITSDLGLAIEDRHDLVARPHLRAGDRRALVLAFDEPERIDDDLRTRALAPDDAWRHVDDTVRWWRRWVERSCPDREAGDPVIRSALVLKALVSAPTGAIVAAPTTALPETIGGSRNWDYRYSWVRDSWLTVRSLGEIGFDEEADGFRRFVERSAAGSADELQLVYGVDGRHRLVEHEIPSLEGYRRSAPVRVGNHAHRQLQLDTYGYLLELAWRWSERGHRPDPDYWRFLVEVVDLVAARWREPDQGIWEVRSEPRHFVQSKALCWIALDRGVRLAEVAPRDGVVADVDGWRTERDALREDVDRRGVSERRGCFTRSYDSDEVDAALLMLPELRYVDHRDPRMAATVDAIIEDLDDGGLIRRYRGPDGLEGHEGTFVTCTFWMVEALLGLGRREEAEAYHRRALATANDLGLFAEEVDVATGEMLGNFPQGLSHLGHVGAAVALERGSPI